ncbi:MAG: type IV pilus twitching motility protein PilT [Myxococcota bacterium]
MQKRVMDRFLAHGVKTGASDLHFLVGDRPSYRIDGKLRPVKYEPLSPADTRQICENLVEGSLDFPLEEVQEHDCSYSVEGVARFRVNIYRQRGSLCCVLRVIPSKIPKLEELGLPERISQLADEERGLVLVTGATGSGKSSTLAAMIRHINQTRAAHILTIEDPIEFLHSNAQSSISQREVGPDTKSFTTALRSSLRQDPDVILVGEMRDPETIDIALKAAETGHMVFSTVHTTDAAKTVGRLVSMFPTEEQPTARIRLADNLRGVISQRLLPRADGKGRVVAAEVMVATKTVQEHIKDPEKTGQLNDVIERGRDQYGMQSFDQHLTDLYRAGTISIEVAMAAASNPSDFERALHFSEASGDGDAPGAATDLSTATFNLEAEKPADGDSLFEEIDDGLGTDAAPEDENILELVER